MGDVLLSTPVIRSLRKSHPHAHITMVVNKGTEEVIQHNPDINKIIALDRERLKATNLWKRLQANVEYIREVRRHRYDLVLDLTGGDRSAILSLLTKAPIRLGLEVKNPTFSINSRFKNICYTATIKPKFKTLHAIDYHLSMIEFLGLEPVKDGLEIFIPQSDKAFVENWLRQQGIGSNISYVAIHPGARWWFKQWPLGKFAILADRIQSELGVPVVFIGGEKEIDDLNKIEEHMETDAIMVKGKFSVLQIAALTDRAALFVGNDNGPMHIAAAVKTPVIALFGPSDPAVWGPWGDGHVVIQKEVPCCPCPHRGCKMGEKNCMELISVEEVFEKVSEKLNKVKFAKGFSLRPKLSARVKIKNEPSWLN